MGSLRARYKPYWNIRLLPADVMLLAPTECDPPQRFGAQHQASRLDPHGLDQAGVQIQERRRFVALHLRAPMMSFRRTAADISEDSHSRRRIITRLPRQPTSSRSTSSLQA